MADTRFDRAIEALARRQHGAFSIAQVHQVDGDRQKAKRRVAAGRWLRLERGVYALPGNPPTMLRQFKAAELAVRGSALSGTSAAVLHGLPGFRLGRIELSADRSAGRTRLATVRHRLPVPVTRIEGIRVTTTAQTLVDVTGTCDAACLAAAIDHAVLAGKTDLDELASVWRVGRARHASGVRLLGRLLAERSGSCATATSELEAALYPLLQDPRLPAFVAQAPAPWESGGGQTVDAWFPGPRRIVEGDGRSWHARVADFERDRARDHAAQRAGIEVSRFTWEQIHTPGYVVGVLLAVFQRRAA